MRKCGKPSGNLSISIIKEPGNGTIYPLLVVMRNLSKRFSVNVNGHIFRGVCVFAYTVRS